MKVFPLECFSVYGAGIVRTSVTDSVLTTSAIVNPSTTTAVINFSTSPTTTKVTTIGVIYLNSMTTPVTNPSTAEMNIITYYYKS